MKSPNKSFCGVIFLISKKLLLCLDFDIVDIVLLIFFNPLVLLCPKSEFKI